jgi:hypothetical protein
MQPVGCIWDQGAFFLGFGFFQFCDSPLSQGFFQGFCDVAKVAIIEKFI